MTGVYIVRSVGACDRGLTRRGPCLSVTHLVLYVSIFKQAK